MEKLTTILVVHGDEASNESLLAKAVALARRSGARLEILLPDPTVASGLATWFSSIGFAERVSYVLDASGDSLQDVILRHIRDHPSDLVMKAASGALALRRVLHAADDMDLAAALPVPLLRTGPKAWRREMRVAATVDVSERDGDAVARSILHAAGMIAMHCDATLDVLYSEREAHDDNIRMERAVRVARLVREFHVGGERLRLLSGPPDETLPRAVSTGDYDLVAVGTIPRRAATPWAPALTSLLTNESQADVMLVKETRRVAADFGLRAKVAAASIPAHP
jgi:nucleotide-binding universal stress UspA family protein